MNTKKESDRKDKGIMSLLNSRGMRQGMSFGIVSSVMTVLGITIGVWASAGKRKTIIASIVGLCLSNSLADGLSIFIADRATGNAKTALMSASVTAIVEFILPIMFLIPFLYMDVDKAVVLTSVIALGLVSATGLYVGELNDKSRKGQIEESGLYLGLTFVIMFVTFYGGNIVNKLIK